MKQLHQWLTNGLMHYCLERPDIGLFISTHPKRGTTTAEMKKIRKAGNKNPEGPILTTGSFCSCVARIDLIDSVFLVVNNTHPEATLDAWEAFLEPTIAQVDKFAMVGTFIFVLNTRRKAFAEVAAPHTTHTTHHSPLATHHSPLTTRS
jgi:hypothetical protein